MPPLLLLNSEEIAPVGEVEHSKHAWKGVKGLEGCLKLPGKRTREKTSIFFAANLKFWNQADTLFVGSLLEMDL